MRPANCVQLQLKPTPMRLPFFYGWLIVAVVFVSMGIGVNARTAFSLLFPPILDEFRWERAVTAGAFSFGFLVSAIMSPLLGRMMDRVGPRAVMEFGVGSDGRGPAARAANHRALASLCHARRPSWRWQRLPRLFWPVAVPSQLVRAPSGTGYGHRVCRRRHRLHRAPARRPNGDRKRRLAHGMLGNGSSGAHRAGADQPAAP